MTIRINLHLKGGDYENKFSFLCALIPLFAQNDIVIIVM